MSRTPGDGRSAAGSSTPAGRAPRAAGKRGGAKGDVERRLKLRHVLFLILVLSGIIPLLISSWRLVRENGEILTTHEKTSLSRSAEQLAEELSEELAHESETLRQLGRAVMAPPGSESVVDRLQEPWVEDLVRHYTQSRRDIVAFDLVGVGAGDLVGLQSEYSAFGPQVQTARNAAIQEARAQRATVYKFAAGADATRPLAAVAVPTSTAAQELLIAHALVELPLGDLLAAPGSGVDGLLLIDPEGRLLWSSGANPEMDRALLASDIVTQFVSMPVAITRELDLEVGGDRVRTLAHGFPVRESGWGVVGHKPAAWAFHEVEMMVANTAFLALVLVAVALVFAFFAARFFGRPIQRLTDTTRQIANGNFGRRVDTGGLALELGDLAHDFNRMSDYVENYVAQLREAAQQNRELFISSIRAFAAAIDAKDPYTRGHSERVAAYSRTIARYLGMPDELVERVWISAVLHDVGKIGVEDRVLKKGGVLTPEEFEQMKLHPVIGAEIVEPISALREMIPGIRWHHEAWNGSGYPDGLRGEQIPLMARILGVADTFDAITTNRPYQTASTPETAIGIIKKLTGTKFDAKITTAFLLAWEAGRIKMDRERAESESTEIRLGAQPASDVVTN